MGNNYFREDPQAVGEVMARWRGERKKIIYSQIRGGRKRVYAGEIGAFDEEVGSNVNRGREGSVGYDSVL